MNTICLSRFPVSLFVLIIFSLFLCQCATKGSPGGGPVDRTPPEIIQTYPLADSLRVSKGLPVIEVSFSERMDEGSLSRSIFISPPLEYELKWKSGSELKLELVDSLKADKTYVVAIGSGARDARNNNMAASYQFAFSTGDTIDQGSIAGRVYGLKKNEPVQVFAFNLNDTTRSGFTSAKPSYVSQTGDNGDFLLSYLQLSEYRLFAVRDQNNNLEIDAATEPIGIPYRDVSLDSGRIQFEGMNFRMSQVDTSAPRILGPRPVYNNYIQLRLSEPVLAVPNKSITLTDSISGLELPVLATSKNDKYNNIIDIYTEVMDSATVYELNIPVLKDSSGNTDNLPARLSFESNSRRDTTGFRIIEIFPKDSARAIAPEAEVRLEFSSPVAWASVAENVLLLSAGGDTLTGAWDNTSLFKGEFKTRVSFQPDSSYRLVMNQGGIKNLWGKVLADTVVSHYFSVVSLRELGELSGTVTVADSIQKPVFLKLSQLGSKKRFFEKKLPKPGYYRMDKLPQADYRAECFLDSDENGVYSNGKLFPFEFAEPFFVSPDTVSVRKRWEKEGIDLHIPGRYGD